MPEPIEIRAFMGLGDTFRQRQWTNPLKLPLQEETTGMELLKRLDIPRETVEVIFVNGKAYTPDNATVCCGDRIALAPPGVPGPYRVLLGFKNMG